MKKSRFRDAQIGHALRQSEVGSPVAGIMRKIGVSQITYYALKNSLARERVEIRELRQLREETWSPERLVADLGLDKTMLQEAIAKRLVAARRRRVARIAVKFSERRAGLVPVVNRRSVRFESVKTGVPPAPSLNRDFENALVRANVCKMSGIRTFLVMGPSHR